MKARLVLVLHSHLPYVKNQGRWPFGEVWLYEAMAETYIPIYRAWQRLKADGIVAPLTLGLSPTLLEQVNQPEIQQGFLDYLKRKEAAARADERQFMAQGEAKMAELASDYRRFYQDVRRDYVAEYGMDLLEPLRRWAAQGDLNIITTAATHAYLPLIDDHASLVRQVRRGIETFERHIGIRPEGFWLPECGYKEGLEAILEAEGIRYFFVDSHALEGGYPAQVSSMTEMDTEEDAEESAAFYQHTGLSTYSPYHIDGRAIAVFGRNALVSYQVWSKDYGYPGDAVYRDFHKHQPESGLKYWQVTDRTGDMGNKTLYNPEAARVKVASHARHFTSVLAETGRKAAEMGFPDPIIVACYDTELFGHWWWEGADWLEAVARSLHETGAAEMTQPTAVLQRSILGPAQVLESSWGIGGKHFGWYNRETGWMWDTIRKAREEFREIEQLHGQDIDGRVVRQAERELMLMESSDWFFMVTNNHTRDYALKRFFEHYGKLTRLADMLRMQRYDEASLRWLSDVEAQDALL
ncbi:MAG: 1,4-alpha-glucan branching protein domain-containing protein [Solirubrobacterales bacterium]